jgi:hypothetical protein
MNVLLVSLYRVSHSGLASHREDVPNNYHLKVFFQLVCVGRKIEIREEKRKMMSNLNVQFNGSAINLRVSGDEETLGPTHLQPSDRP